MGSGSKYIGSGKMKMNHNLGEELTSIIIIHNTPPQMSIPLPTTYVFTPTTHLVIPTTHLFVEFIQVTFHVQFVAYKQRLCKACIVHMTKAYE